MVDIYWAAKQRGKYPPLPMTLRWIIVLVYTTQIQKKQLISLNVQRNAGRKLNSTHNFVLSATPRWLVLAIDFQKEWKAPFTCVVNTNFFYELRW